MANNNQSTKGGERCSIRQFATKLCVSIALFAGLLVTGECVAFLLLSRWTAPNMFKYEYRSYVVWRALPPNSHTMMTVDADGLRRTMYSHCEADDYTIWMFGDSGLWGNYVRDGETVPSLVAKRYEDSGHPVCVRNYGQIAWTSTQEVIQLLLELKRIRRKPDVVIFYDGTEDSVLPYETDEFDVHSGYADLKKRFENQGEKGFAYFGDTNTYLLLQRLAGKLHLDVHTSISAGQLTAKAQRSLDNYLENMEIAGALATHYGFHYVWFWEPWLQPSQKPLSAAELLSRDREEMNHPGRAEVVKATYDLMRTVNRPHLVNLADIFKDHPETLFLDSYHLGVDGNRLIAERIFQVLQHLGS